MAYKIKRVYAEGEEMTELYRLAALRILFFKLSLNKSYGIIPVTPWLIEMVLSEEKSRSIKKIEIYTRVYTC